MTLASSYGEVRERLVGRASSVASEAAGIYAYSEAWRDPLSPTGTTGFFSEMAITLLFNSTSVRSCRVLPFNSFAIL